MKKLICIALILSTLLLISACATEEESMDFKMTATLLAVGEKLEVNVTEAEYASGIHLIIVGSATEIYGADGDRISKDLLCVGDELEIYYSGQVMMSYPPQVAALKIRVL